MPIKFPKFTRRKSAGNVSYEPANRESIPEDRDPGSDSLGSGFRVLPQPNRGSGHTTSSGFSGIDYAGSSNRLSSNSTLPSTDSPRTPDEYRPQSHADSYYAGGKGKRPVGNTSSPSQQSTMNAPRLETTLDTSSLFDDDVFEFDRLKKGKNDGGSMDAGSIIPTMPKIASSSIINSNDHDTNIPPAPPPRSYDPRSSTSTAPYAAGTGNAYTNIFASSHHMDADRPSSNNNELSPYQWDSAPSDGHPSNTTVPASRNARNLTAGQKPAVVSHKRMDSLEAPSSIRPVPKTKGSGGDSPGLKRASAVVRRSSLPYEDEDALIVANSVARQETRGARPQPKQTNSSGVDTAARKDRDNGWLDALPSISSSDNSVRSGSSKETTYTSPMVSRGNNSPVDKQTVIASNDTTPRAQKTRLVGKRGSNEPEDEVDSSISAAAAVAARYESSETKQPNKVMTRAQFERYQQEQDERRMLSGKPDDDDESDISDYEEESEVEKSKEIARQRARQEAHLSVYRQQMMKISGTDPADTPPLTDRPASISSPALPLSLSSVDPGSSGKNSDEEEDEEIPLGILMAHGFPSKNRPPTRLSTASSQPNLRASAQAAAQRDSHLPPFARHLPADPYNVGASIVNPMNRASLAFGVGNDARSVAGGSMYNGAPPSQLPSRAPQGLVGEIVRAEEMKAARRGGQSQFMQSQPDPFKQDPLDRHNGGRLGFSAQQGGMGGMGGMGNGAVGVGMGMGMGGSNMGPGTGPAPPGMGMQGGMNQSDAMQAQMANMQQYMQMQMQLMQMQMQQLQVSSQPQQQQLMAPMMGSMQRPTSMMSMNPPVGGLGTLPQGPPRTMSMMDNQFPQLQTSNGAPFLPSVTTGLMQPPASNGFLGPQGYTPSIAPSERSNVGLPSRYRPVSHQPGPPGGTRSATFTSATTQDWTRKSAGPSHLKNASADEDEDDESGWEALRKRRKEKSDDWRKKKEAGGLQGILGFGSSAASSNTTPTA